MESDFGEELISSVRKSMKSGEQLTNLNFEGRLLEIKQLHFIFKRLERSKDLKHDLDHESLSNDDRLLILRWLDLERQRSNEVSDSNGTIINERP